MAAMPERERMMWAGLATLVGVIHDGHHGRTFERLEAACRSFGVPEAWFDGLAKRFGFYYDRSTDAYVDHETWLRLKKLSPHLLH